MVATTAKILIVDDEPGVLLTMNLTAVTRQAA